MSKVIWFTGLSGSGKTTLANRLKYDLSFNSNSNRIIILDGDELRKGLNNNLKFSNEDRKENIRRTAEVAKLFAENNFIVICSLITPTNEIRELVKTIIPEAILVYLSTSYSICKQRDVKGLYASVERGEIKNFTGKDSIFEIPNNADLILDTEIEGIEACVKKIIIYSKF